jgi:hypothetical protein
MESTISIPEALNCSTYPGIRSRLLGMSGLPPGKAQTTSTFASEPVAAGSFINLVKAMTCEVSQPMIPTRTGLSAPAGDANVIAIAVTIRNLDDIDGSAKVNAL